MKESRAATTRRWLSTTLRRPGAAVRGRWRFCLSVAAAVIAISLQAVAKHEVALAVQLEARRVGASPERRAQLGQNAQRHEANAASIHAVSACVCLVGLLALGWSKVRHEPARASIVMVLLALWLLFEFVMV